MARAALKAMATIHAPKKLDIACGDRLREGFTGIDIAGDAAIQHDLFVYPWPIATGVVEQINISHFCEHIPHSHPNWPSGVDGWWMFWDEVYRICAPEALVDVVSPYVRSDRAFWDPTHTRFLHEMTWYYLDKNWRQVQQLDHEPIASNFEVVVIAGNGISDDMATRSQDFQTFARAHYWNVVQDLNVTLKARKD